MKHRRHWSPFGCRPPWIHDDRYQWLWLYAAVEPATGAAEVLFLPRTDAACFQVFLNHLRKAFPEASLGLLMDNNASHKSGNLRWPDQVHSLFIPPYSPELNPAERWLEVMRKEIADHLFDTMEDMQQTLTNILSTFWEDPQSLKKLTAYPWWRNALPDAQ